MSGRREASPTLRILTSYGDKIAKALGVSRPTIDVWIKKVESDGNAKDKRKNPAKKAQDALEIMPATKAEHPAHIPALQPTIDLDWVRIRNDCWEIEVAEKDFWSLLPGK